MNDATELKDHVYDIVGALHSVHDELGPCVNEYENLSWIGNWARAS